ncbi:DEAD/DEAH box helicase [Leifsonia sp. 2TAF2]|uniref:DEAD/DEAH box helicase n=1 Tax=Leifsonia sp. 2TAF2 TaxID=3233009 RepID=UPI003F9D7D7E
MSELLPSIQADDIREGLVDYLTTTFALSDPEARLALQDFLTDPENGVFKGPFVRLRVPFRPADDGWRDSLEWHEGFAPYGHQARAFERLSSSNLSADKPRPLATLVTTGTGSGKTEAFLYPILDHVIRAKRAGEPGIKALILYPMNALANDQARRLTELITTQPALAGVRAALYTGQKGPDRSVVSPDGLITDRQTMRADPPDILLTNYKMLDQLLLRTADQNLWKESATSLRYLVLDEFHTYDGAQGTDVAMLLRRLGLALKRGWPSEHPLLDAEAYARPLGLMTPVATSATLGDREDPKAMLTFAETVFGQQFDDDAVITETRLTLEDWADGAPAEIERAGLAAARVDNAMISNLASRVRALREGSQESGPDALTEAVFSALYDGWIEPHSRRLRDDPEFALALTQAHPFTHDLTRGAEFAVSLTELAEAVLPAGLASTETYEDRAAARHEVLAAIIGALSHVRFLVGRAALSVDLHLWTRALTRINRVAGPTTAFRWDDDGLSDVTDSVDPFEIEGRPEYPAVYCRHCGRSGWGVQLAPTGYDLDTDDAAIRRNHLAREGRFRALMYAPAEADHDPSITGDHDAPPMEGLRWFWTVERKVSPETPDLSGDAFERGQVLPVLALTGEDADDDSRNDTCPSCQRADGIRFLGSAIATMLSVAVTTIFGDARLDGSEKKALVFTDSVQDAAHRAGFVQSRSHVFTLRNAIREAIGDYPIALDALVDELLKLAGDDRFKRYRLLGPDVAERAEFRPFWEKPTARAVPAPVVRRVRKRLLLDVELEFGLQSRVGRTLELTGSVAAEVDAGAPSKLESIGRTALDGFTREAQLGEIEPAERYPETVVLWVRGVLERMRDRGAIQHEWFTKYIESDGRRWAVWGGRPRGEGMPAFPEGRDAPGYPRVGGPAPGGKDNQKTQLDVVTSPQSWFAVWTRKVLRVTAGDGARLSKSLLAHLAADGVISAVPIGASGAIAYQLSPSRVTVTPIRLDDWVLRRHLLVCDICQNPVTGTAQVIDQLADGPCTAARCPGTLRREGAADNYYRRLYGGGDMRRVVAREHTGLLDDAIRLDYETSFKSGSDQPDAPNVLVATPTLEMGIDIGDLSTVMLAGLPRSVASYLQRVGRAGRLTGNSLSLAFVTGRGEQLPKIGDPLSVINGQVRAPATYLNAEEILRRQYLAGLIDRRASGLLAPPTRARDVLASTEERSFLGDLISDAEQEHAARTADFLGAFPGLSASSVDSLRAWAAPGTEPGSSGLAEAARHAVQRWNAELSLLKHRRKAVSEALERLEKEADHPAATEELKTEARAARASYKLVSRVLQELRNEPWIGALERFGLLPNYTLLDDAVRLDVALSWIEPDTGEFQNDAITYERGAGVALGELAPGATFYAQGAEIAIDAVDLGIEGEAVKEWIYCPACGFAQDTALSPAPNTCPRCGSKAIADAAQRMSVVELERVSAEVRRDEATINDRRDDRERTRFSIHVAADIDPASVTNQWFVAETGFGVKYVRDLTIRWLNLGRIGGFSPSKIIAGEERQSSLFRVCEVCGKLDSAANANSRREHRFWCPYRTSTSEHVTNLALSRTLTTQGVVLRLPLALTIGDSLAVPSLVAAIMLGLRETLGGDPDHLRVVSIVDPVLSDGGDNIPSLLIHDSVPGGTGYLAELANVPQIRSVFETAWRIVRDCPCANENRNACHRCVLPFAPGRNGENVARASAEQALRKLLDVDSDGEPGSWTVTQVDNGQESGESVIEQYFRKVFIDRARALGATVKEIAGDWGNKVQVTVPGSRRIWLLRPQVPLGHTTPDFVLESHGGGVIPLAIYTDGRAFHATVAHNRIADDAAKRRGARDLGYHVIAVTWDDVERAEKAQPEPSAAWFSKDVAANFTGHFGLSLSSLDHIVANPINQIMDWIQDPVSAQKRWAGIARSLPVLVMNPMGTFIDREGLGLDEVAVKALSGAYIAATDQPDTFLLRLGATALVGRLLDQNGTTECVLAVDDRSATLQGAGFPDAWRLWLRLANVLGPNTSPSAARIVAFSEIASGAATSEGKPELVSEEIDQNWRQALAEANDQEAAVLVSLANDGSVSPPDIGLELGDGIPVSLVWTTERVAASADLSESDIHELTDAGWMVVGLDAIAIIAALDEKRS